MAHYQLSYGFNSNDSPATNINNASTNLELKTPGSVSIEDTSESGINVNEKSETEKRKLPQQPSEPGKHCTLCVSQH